MGEDKKGSRPGAGGIIRGPGMSCRINSQLADRKSSNRSGRRDW